MMVQIIVGKLLVQLVGEVMSGGYKQMKLDMDGAWGGLDTDSQDDVQSTNTGENGSPKNIEVIYPPVKNVAITPKSIISKHLVRLVQLVVKPQGDVTQYSARPVLQTSSGQSIILQNLDWKIGNVRRIPNGNLHYMADVEIPFLLENLPLHFMVLLDVITERNPDGIYLIKGDFKRLNIPLKFSIDERKANEIARSLTKAFEDNGVFQITCRVEQEDTADLTESMHSEYNSEGPNYRIVIER